MIQSDSKRQQLDKLHPIIRWMVNGYRMNERTSRMEAPSDVSIYCRSILRRSLMYFYGSVLVQSTNEDQLVARFLSDSFHLLPTSDDLRSTRFGAALPLRGNEHNENIIQIVRLMDGSTDGLME